jgi:ATP-binding protein involved in chromosome partitioning
MIMENRKNNFMDNKKIEEKMQKIKHKLVVLSGKGGVGKSSVSVNLAYGLAMKGFKVGLLDVDIHGPNVVNMLGLEKEKLQGEDNEILPVKVKENLKVVSMAFLLEKSETPVIWRGPMKMKAINQFLGETKWGELDFLITDSPPGTGDEPLTVCQLIPGIDGSIIVTTPQEIALLDVRKTIRFSQQLNVPIMGVVENMSYLICPYCGKKIRLFGEGGGEKLQKEFDVPLLGKIPFSPEIAEFADKGKTVFDASEENKKIFKELAEKVIEKIYSKSEK